MSTMSFAVKWEEKELKRVSVAEGVSVEKLQRLLDAGRVVIPRNVKRAEESENRGIVLKAIGEGMSTKVNVNVGTSKDYVNLDEEVEKAKIALQYGADAIMDLSTGGDLDETRRTILKDVNVPVGTVPIYQAALEKADVRAVVDMSSDDMFRRHVQRRQEPCKRRCGLCYYSCRRESQFAGAIEAERAHLRRGESWRCIPRCLDDPQRA